MTLHAKQQVCFEITHKSYKTYWQLTLTIAL